MKHSDTSNRVRFDLSVKNLSLEASQTLRVIKESFADRRSAYDALTELTLKALSKIIGDFGLDEENIEEQIRKEEENLSDIPYEAYIHYREQLILHGKEPKKQYTAAVALFRLALSIGQQPVNNQKSTDDAKRFAFWIMVTAMQEKNANTFRQQRQWRNYFGRKRSTRDQWLCPHEHRTLDIFRRQNGFLNPRTFRIGHRMMRRVLRNPHQHDFFALHMIENPSTLFDFWLKDYGPGYDKTRMRLKKRDWEPSGEEHLKREAKALRIASRFTDLSYDVQDTDLVADKPLVSYVRYRLTGRIGGNYVRKIRFDCPMGTVERIDGNYYLFQDTDNPMIRSDSNIRVLNPHFLRRLISYHDVAPEDVPFLVEHIFYRLSEPLYRELMVE